MSSIIARIGERTPTALPMARDFARLSRSTPLPQASKGCIFFLPYRVNPGAHWLEFVLGHAFRLRGYRAVFGIGEDATAFTDGYFCTKSRLRARMLSMLRTGQFASAFRAELCFFSKLLGRRTLLALREEARAAALSDVPVYEKHGVVIGPQVLGSLSRYFLRCEVDLERHSGVAREFLLNALASLEAARRVVEEYAPRLMVASHGIYASWGVFCDYFAARGIPFVTWGKQYLKHAFLFSHNKSYHRDIIEEPDDHWRAYAVGPRERAVLIDYIDQKASLRSHSDAINYYRTASRGSGKLKGRIGNAALAVFGMFPNISWDAQVSFRPLFYRSMNEWLVETIRWFVRHPDRVLVVRAHPAEIYSHVETVEKASDVIARHFPLLPRNVIVLPADDEVTSYDVLAEVDACLVYGSKFGLEAALERKPLIIAGEAYFRGKGMSYDPLTEAEYFTLLERAPQRTPVTEAMAENAIAYGYHYFFRRQMILPLAQMKGAEFQHYLFDEAEQLAPGHIEELDDLIERMLSGRAFVNPSLC